MSEQTTWQKVAKELAEAFETSTRPDGSKYIRFREGCPGWINSDLAHKFHEAVDDRLPDDWIYESAGFIADSLAEYEDERSTEDAIREIADGLVDVYNADRLKWLASHLSNAFLCDDAEKELGAAEDMLKRIAYGQYVGLERIARSLVEIITERAEEVDAEAEEEEPDDDDADS